MAKVAELATVAELVAVKQARRSGRDENRQQARKRKHRGEANRETPEWVVNLHVLPFDNLRHHAAITRGRGVD